MPAPTLVHALMAPVLAGVLVPAAVVDVRTRTIPDALTAAGAAGALLVRLAVDPAGLPGAAACALALGGGLAVLALLAPGGMGMGDAKLVAVLGLALGPGAAVALLAGCAAASARGAATLVRDGPAAARRLTVPLAPYLGLGAAGAWALGWP